ncbi:MAG TPA: hypothetical protein VGL72_19440 [Bryobacteraceae bacterium]|jgi:hypothetical protein
MTCASPIDAALLADYWLAVLPQPQEEAIEEHLFECDPCSARCREVIALAEAVRELARQGSLLMVVSDAFLKRVAEEGRQVREYAPPNGGSIACTVTAEDDFLIGRLTADLAGAARVDLSLCDAQGAEKLRLEDIPFRSEAGSVAFQQSITYAKAARSETLIARLLAFDEKGSQHLAGEYTFHHTRTLPGPGVG